MPRAIRHRHQLLGINLFALEMFDQFRAEFGLFKFDPNLPGPLAKQIFSQRLRLRKLRLKLRPAPAK
jgi:hypothetical protein